MTSANFRVAWTVKVARTREEAVRMAKKAVGDRLASKGKIIGVANVLTSTEVDPQETRVVDVYTVQVDVETPLTWAKLAKIFDGWKITDLTLLKPALAGSEAA